MSLLDRALAAMLGTADRTKCSHNAYAMRATPTGRALADLVDAAVALRLESCPPEDGLSLPALYSAVDAFREAVER